MTDDARLSRMLFSARESLSMWADVVEGRMGVPDLHTRKLIADIDEYRAERGWSPHGFGGEGPTRPRIGPGRPPPGPGSVSKKPPLEVIVRVVHEEKDA